MRNIVSKSTLREFWEQHPESEQSLRTWYAVVSKATWNNSNEIKVMYKHASIIRNSRVVFNICGNKYRLIVKFEFQKQWAWIRFIGTHAEYDKIDANTI